MQVSFLYVVRHKGKIFIGFTGLLLIGIFGATLVKSNYFLLEDLKKDNKMRIQFDYFDASYMGLRPFELSIQVKDSTLSVYDYEILNEINKLDSFLVHDYGLTQTFSIIALLKIANRTEHGGQSSYYKFPGQKDTEQYLKTVKKIGGGRVLNRLIDSTGHYCRISSTTGDIGKIAIAEKNKRLDAFIENNINTDMIHVRQTGTGFLLDKNMGTISTNLTLGLILAILIVSVLMGVLYRSLKMVLIALVPNMLPFIVSGSYIRLFWY